MTTLLEISDAHKRYGEQELLDGANVVISDGHNIGLIGRNGAGKSTLCRCLLGEEELDAGEVIHHPRLRLGYLRQHDPFEPGESVHDFLIRDSGQADWRCGEVAGQFELKGPQLDRPVTELSGGWQTRVKLAALLLHDPNLLVLDEPTNFLDLRTQLLLQEFLRGFDGTCLVVSHDRAFLKATCDRTLELSRGQLTLFSGDVDAFLEHQRERREHDERVNAAVLAKRKQLETFINKNRANANTASQARSKAKQLERLQLTEIEGALATVRLKLPEVDRRQGVALRCTDLAIGYEDNTVAEGIQVEIEHGARTAVVGDNGQGKTTFLRTVTESLPPIEGKIRWGYGCQIGVYAQHVYTSLTEQISVHEYLSGRAATGVNAQAVLDVAGSFLFRGDEVQKQVGVLSGGERARLCLAGLLLGGFNVLVLDEPGNHLDVETIEALSSALDRYAGTVIFTSHDRYFLKRVATSIVEVADGRVVNYPGSYEDYLYRIGKEVTDGQRDAAAQQPTAAPEKPKPTKAEGRRLYELQKEAASLERQIAKQEQRKAEFEAKLVSATSGAEARNLRNTIAAIAAKIAPIEEQWLKLQEELEA
jgi:ATP-binding cassette subfamily F protein 3